ncbi:MAG: AMP-dependent synthetase [Bacteroidetes bacterium HGW-Bacteroidetes-6]|jgi:long-chain acyl-CoA synthetase|nr:MAG: AMP-dependent synthetase [Bacteroidetes bacterium HGW-Bacteroidetes-6]
MIKYTIPHFFNDAVYQFSGHDALSFTDEKPVSYQELALKISSTISYLQENNISKGDRVAIWGSNSPQWGIAYLAITCMGAVVVPLLPEVPPADAEIILRHSGTEILFTSQTNAAKITSSKFTQPGRIVILEDLLANNDTTNRIFDFANSDVTEDDLAAIIYTSGTTGRAKGVMLTHRNISHVAWHSRNIQPINSTDRFLSVLPMAHTYENSLGFLFPVFNGACIYYLRKAPTASVLLPVLLQIRPTLMLTVPLIIEKMFRMRIKPQLTKGIVLRTLYKIGPFRKLLHRMAGKKLMKTFGGEIKFFGIGGAKLNPTVERFLKEARFPYAIGYGLTESAPLLAGANGQHTRFESTGPALFGVELKIENPDPKTGEGEIWAKGPNVMKGYYREPELTSEVITPDGWLKTGDLGKIDKRNYLYIRGRLKNIIITSTGKNIYPEDIEALINNHRFVAESLVIERKGKLVALVQLNMEELEQQFNLLLDAIDARKSEILEEIRQYVNAHVSQLSQIQSIVFQAVPFEKTATQKIKRFMYQ